MNKLDGPYYCFIGYVRGGRVEDRLAVFVWVEEKFEREGGWCGCFGKGVVR